MGIPECYDGDPTTCNAFLCNCSIIFALQPLTFASEEARVVYTINHLSGRARLWGTEEWQRGTPTCRSFQTFADELRRVFDTGPLGAEADGNCWPFPREAAQSQTTPLTSVPGPP